MDFAHNDFEVLIAKPKLVDRELVGILYNISGECGNSLGLSRIRFIGREFANGRVFGKFPKIWSGEGWHVEGWKAILDDIAFGYQACCSLVEHRNHWTERHHSFPVDSLTRRAHLGPVATANNERPR